MNPIRILPYSVVLCPEIGVVDVVNVRGRCMVRVTDAAGKAWYIRSVHRDGGYEWTRNVLFARDWALKTAQKHADVVKRVWHESALELEGGRHHG